LAVHLDFLYAVADLFNAFVGTGDDFAPMRGDFTSFCRLWEMSLEISSLIAFSGLLAANFLISSKFD